MFLLPINSISQANGLRYLRYGGNSKTSIQHNVKAWKQLGIAIESPVSDAYYASPLPSFL